MIRSVYDFLENSALKFGDKTAFVEGEKSINYANFKKMSDALASHILKYNLKKQAILIILPKSIDALISFYGVARSGAGANIPYFVSLNSNYYALEGSESIVEKLNDKFSNKKVHIACADFTKSFYFDEIIGKVDLNLDRSSVIHNATFVDFRLDYLAKNTKSQILPEPKSSSAYNFVATKI